MLHHPQFPRGGQGEVMIETFFLVMSVHVLIKGFLISEGQVWEGGVSPR